MTTFYFRKNDKNGTIAQVVTYDNVYPKISDPYMAEITKSEYMSIINMIREKNILVDALYNGEITIDDVPTDWQEEIQRRVDALIDLYGAIDEQEISADELQTMLEEVL